MSAVHRIPLTRDCFLLGFDGPALLLDFVQKQWGDEVVAHALGPAVSIGGDQIRTHLGHLLGDQAVLEDSGGIELGLVPEGHRAKLHESIAVPGDVPDFLLEAPG